MTKNKTDYKQLFGLVKSILNYKTDELSDNHLNHLKSILFYIGKVVLLIKNKNVNLFIYDKSQIEYEIKKTEEFFPIIKDINHKFNSDFFDSNKEEIFYVINKFTEQQIENFSLGYMYESLITSNERKKLGQVYTPNEIVKQMVDSTIDDIKIIENPYYRIIDPSCGGGYFLLECYERLKNIYIDNISEIIFRYPDLRQQLYNDVHSFIIKNNLWGYDIDCFAVFTTMLTLLLKCKKMIQPNIFCTDILLDDKNNSLIINRINKNKQVPKKYFDLVIGNPPYIGHKKLDKEYKKILKVQYQDVFSNKSDLSYCFFKKSYELLKDNGKLMFITSRYFMEASSANNLRKFIKTNFKINKIIDFYGAKVFNGVGVSPVIIECIKKELKENLIHIYRLDINKRKNKNRSKNNISNDLFKDFYIQKNHLLDNGWILLTKEELKLFNKIEKQGEYLLKEVCNCYQGIITGLDKAFVVSEEVVVNKELEEDIIKIWVKNSDVNEYRIANSKKRVIYTNSINDIMKYPKVINFIKPHKKRLLNRRECRKQLRKWYELQWGRNLDIFKSPKIVFPFKASSNRFAIDYINVLCSADIYIIKVDNNKFDISLEYLLGYLNSALFEFYFKSVSKKVGETMYEYYPNKIMNLTIKIGKNKNIIEESVCRLMFYYKQIENNKNNKNNDKYDKLIYMEKKIINNFFYDLYCINENEISIIKEKNIQ